MAGFAAGAAFGAGAGAAQSRHAADDGRQACAAISLVVFGPADDAIVGGDLEEREIPPPRIAVQVLDLDDLHGVSSARAA